MPGPYATMPTMLSLSAHPRYRPLGKRPARHDGRTLQLASYLKPHLPTPPVAHDWTSKVQAWPMFLNDRIGDCTIAAPAHTIEAWTANAHGVKATITDAQVLDAYKRIGHYNPADPSTDNGCVMLDVMKSWRSTGIGGHKIGAFASVSPRNADLIDDAIWLFGGINVGLALPISAQTQKVWDVVPASNPDGEFDSWGGHAVPILSYGRRGLTCITWGAKQPLTWAFLRTYCDEAYAAITADFISPKTRRAPSGFDLRALTADLAQLR